MEDKILCNVSDLEPIADAVREKENTNKLYSVEELKVKVPELISSGGNTVRTCTVEITTGGFGAQPISTTIYNQDFKHYSITSQHCIIENVAVGGLLYINASNGVWNQIGEGGLTTLNISGDITYEGYTYNYDSYLGKQVGMFRINGSGTIYVYFD